jgi:hypothetical protein
MIEFMCVITLKYCIDVLQRHEFIHHILAEKGD